MSKGKRVKAAWIAYEKFIDELHKNLQIKDTEIDDFLSKINRLTEKKKIALMRVKKKSMERLWDDFESKRNNEDYEGAAEVFSKVLTMGLPKANKLYNEKDNNKPSTLPSEIESEPHSAEEKLRIGLRYHLGLGVKQNYKQSAYWFREAAEEGNVIAKNYLSFAYSRGYGVPKDDEQNFILTIESARRGNPVAQLNIGFIYYMGNDSIQSDKKKAFKWCQKAAMQGYMHAQVLLNAMKK